MEHIESNTKHYVIDKALFEKDKYKKLSDTSKLAYAIYHNYLTVAVDNDWIDENGNFYIELSNNDLGEILNKSNNTVIKIKKELQEVGLLHQKRAGLSKPNRLYIFEPS